MRPGDVVRVDFGLPAGREPSFERPAVVVTARAVLEARPRTIHVVPVTGSVRRSLPTEVAIEATGLDQPSVAQVHLCTVISAERLSSPEDSNIGATSLAQIRSLLADLLDLP